MYKFFSTVNEGNRQTVLTDTWKTKYVFLCRYMSFIKKLWFNLINFLYSYYRFQKNVHISLFFYEKMDSLKAVRNAKDYSKPSESLQSSKIGIPWCHGENHQLLENQQLFWKMLFLKSCLECKIIFKIVRKYAIMQNSYFMVYTRFFEKLSITRKQQTFSKIVTV